MAGSAPASVGSSRRSSDSRQPPARKERSIPEACRVFRRGVASAGLSAHRRHQASARVLPWPARLPWHHVVKLRPILCISSCCRGETATNSRANDVAQASRGSARGIEWLGGKKDQGALASQPQQQNSQLAVHDIATLRGARQRAFIGAARDSPCPPLLRGSLRRHSGRQAALCRFYTVPRAIRNQPGRRHHQKKCSA